MVELLHDPYIYIYYSSIFPRVLVYKAMQDLHHQPYESQLDSSVTCGVPSSYPLMGLGAAQTSSCPGLGQKHSPAPEKLRP